MLEAVPARVVVRVAEAEVGAEVDDRGARRGEIGGDLRARAVGECQEDSVDWAGAGASGNPRSRKCPGPGVPR